MRRVSVIVLLAAAVLAGSFTLTANASSDSTLELTAVSKQFKEIDVGREGISIGDYIVFSDNLFQDEQKVGRLDGTCTFTRVHLKAGTVSQQCLVTATLPDGTVGTQGVIHVAGEDVSGFTTGITGGTGAYAGADGEVHVRFVSDTVTELEVVLNH